MNEQPRRAAVRFRVFDFSFGQMLWSRRSVFLGLLVGAPVVIAVVVRMVAATMGLPVINGAGLNGPTLFGLLIWLLFVRFVVPVLGVLYGTSLIADEVDDKTITYLFTRPVPRASILIGKFLAYLACVLLLVLPAVVVVYFLIIPIGGNIGQSFPPLAAGPRDAHCRPDDLWGAVCVCGRRAETAAHCRAGLRVRLGIDGPGDSGLSQAAQRGLLPPGPGPARHAGGLIHQLAAVDFSGDPPRSGSVWRA